MAFSILFVILTVGPSNDRFRPQTLPCGPRTHLGNMLVLPVDFDKKIAIFFYFARNLQSDQNILSYYDKLTHKFHGFHFRSALIFGNLGDFPTLSITLSRLYCGKKIQTMRETQRSFTYGTARATLYLYPRLLSNGQHDG